MLTSVDFDNKKVIMPETEVPDPTVSADAGATETVVTQPSEPTNGATPSDAGSAVAETQPDVASQPGSLPTDIRSSTPNLAGNTPAKADSQQPQAPVNWEKRFKDSEPYITRLSQERAELQKSLKAWEGLDPQQVREALQRQQQQAEAASLKPWSARHPEFATTKARMDKVRNYFSATEAIEKDPHITPEAKQQIAQRMAQQFGVTRDDAKLYQDFEAEKASVQERLTTDFDGLFQEKFDALFQSKIGEYEQFQSARTKAQSILSENGPLIEKHRDEIAWAMQNPQRSEVAFALVKAREELEALKAKVGQQTEHTETAQAQSAALKQRASVHRDASTRSPAVDPVEEASKLGLSGSRLAEFMLSRRQS